jgi:hypothetical protein
MARYALLAAALLGFTVAQTPGITPEVHPKLTTWKCTKRGGCKAQNTAIVTDSAAHPIHQKNNSTLGCGSWGNGPDPTACPTKEACAKNCIIEGISDYSTVGVFTKGADLRLDMYNPAGNFVSPRVYLLSKDEKNYEMLQLTGNELTFDVDMSKLPCGMNGALYLSEMRADGGRSKLNPKGAAYGTGYCDAQCFVTPWINGEVSTASYPFDYLVFRPYMTTNDAISCNLSSSMLTLHREMLQSKVSAAMKWTSGKPTAAPPLSHRTHAASQASLAAPVTSAARQVSAIRMAALITRTRPAATRPTTA